MKLLRFETESESVIDQVLMVVPDDYKKTVALDEAADVLEGCYIAAETEIVDDASFSMYRIYVG